MTPPRRRTVGRQPSGERKLQRRAGGESPRQSQARAARPSQGAGLHGGGGAHHRPRGGRQHRAFSLVNGVLLSPLPFRSGPPRRGPRVQGQLRPGIHLLPDFGTGGPPTPSSPSSGSPGTPASSSPGKARRSSWWEPSSPLTSSRCSGCVRCSEGIRARRGSGRCSPGGAHRHRAVAAPVRVEHQAIGSTLTLDGRPYTIVGVVPGFPLSAPNLSRVSEVYVPIGSGRTTSSVRKLRGWASTASRG